MDTQSAEHLVRTAPTAPGAGAPGAEAPDAGAPGADKSGPAAAHAPMCLSLVSVRAAGRALGLRPGDMLLRIDGRAFDGRIASLLEAFREAPGGRCALSLRRAGRDWTVLAETPTLGRWRVAPCDVAVPDIDTRGLRNWEVMTSAARQYDAQPQRPGWGAFLVPVHLVQMRLWPPLAIWVALVLISLPLGWILGGAVQTLVWIYFWRAAPALVRADRAARGYRLWCVMAARSESDLHGQLAAGMPDLRFVHAPRTRPS